MLHANNYMLPNRFADCFFIQSGCIHINTEDSTCQEGWKVQKSVISWLWGIISDRESAGMNRESCVSKRNSTLMNMWINDEEDKKIMGDRDGREGRKWG